MLATVLGLFAMFAMLATLAGLAWYATLMLGSGRPVSGLGVHHRAQQRRIRHHLLAGLDAGRPQRDYDELADQAAGFDGDVRHPR